MASNLGALVIRSQRTETYEKYDSMSETLLVEKCRLQDPHAFSQFVDLYQGRVFGFIKRMTPNAEEAADLTQEVFIRAFQHFHKFDLRSSVKTWLFKIAHNLCIDQSRRRARTPEPSSLYGDRTSDEIIEISDTEWQPDLVVADAEFAEALETAIARMSEKLRVVLLMHDREDLSYEEIAELLAIPIGTVKSRLFLGRAFLQNELSSYLNGAESKRK